MAKKKAKKKATPVKRVPKPVADTPPAPPPPAKPEVMVLKKGFVTTKDRRIIPPGGKFRKDEMDEKKFKGLEERGLVERFTAEKKDIVKK